MKRDTGPHPAIDRLRKLASSRRLISRCGPTAFAGDELQSQIDAAKTRAAQWLCDSATKDTEDRVFRLLAFDYAAVPPEQSERAVAELLEMQRSDGGWAQLSNMDSDAYATATVLVALHRAGVKTSVAACMRGLQFLLDSQLNDGSWQVASRSQPFQKYFESGFPHGQDQFISTTATAWATLALLFFLPEQEPRPIETLTGTFPLELPEADLSAFDVWGSPFHRCANRPGESETRFAGLVSSSRYRAAQ
ncbi:MAG: prenyltransferase/squalene oxidase repeat-containing protein [Pirellulaceae bacterium]